MQVLRKTLVQAFRTAFIFTFVATWLFSARPQMFRFPENIQKAEAAINFVQGGFSKSATQLVSVTSSVTYAGDLLVVVADWDNSLNLSSISDTQGNLYATAIGPISWFTGNVNRTQMFYAKNIRGGPNTVTVMINGTPAFGFKLDVVEYSGADTVSPLDATSVATGEGTALDSGSVSTSSGNELIFGYGDLAAEFSPLTARNGFSARTQYDEQNSVLSEDKNVTSAGLYNATISSGLSRSWLMMMATFKSNMSGYGVSSRSDTLSDSRPSVTSNHTFGFTANHSVSTLTFALPSGFTTSGIDCGDIDAATSSPFNFNYPDCAPTATAWGAQVKAVISNVQFNATDAGAVDTNATPFNANNIAGDFIVVVVDWGNVSATVSSITDTNGNTYTSALGPINWFGLAPTYRSQIFYAKNIAGGANTVTVRLTAASSNNLEVYIHEYSGVDTVSPFDTTSSATSDSGVVLDSGFATTHAANELLFGVGIGGAGTVGPGTGFNTRSTFNYNVTEDKSVTSIGAYKATATADVSASWLMMMATFKAAGAGSVLTLTAPLDSAVHVATGTPLSVYVGSNATTTQQGVHWIKNPSTAGTYTITLGGTSKNSGNFLVAINGGQTVAATVAESLALTVSSVPLITIQMVQVQKSSCDATNPQTVAISSSGPGNLIVVGVIAAVGQQVSSITDNATGGTNSYVSTGAKASDTNGGVTEIWYAKNSRAGATTVTINYGSGNLGGVVWEFSGVDTVAPLDATSTLSNQSASLTPVGPTLNTATAGEVIVSLVAVQNNITGMHTGNVFSNDFTNCNDGEAHLPPPPVRLMRSGTRTHPEHMLPMR